uniref:Uncharacterized protein n=1 Tax=Meloidogyne hapla TaxID=6305 RepID=A0A1I8BV76_MELHA
MTPTRRLNFNMPTSKSRKLSFSENQMNMLLLNHLHEENRRLYNISVVFRLKQIPKDIFKFQRDPTG